MSRFEFEDRLEVLGILAGAFVILFSLAVLSGLPWTTNDDTLAVVIQLVGILAAIGVGVVLILVTYTGDVRALLPGSDE